MFCEEHSFLQRMLARIIQCVAGAVDGINGGRGKGVFEQRLDFGEH